MLVRGDNLKTWKQYAIRIGLAEAVGALAALLARGGIKNFNETAVKPALMPPGFLFPLVWALLYALMGISAARIALAPPSLAQTQAKKIYRLQLAFNFFWSIIFFSLQAYGLALIWILILWSLIIAMIVSFHKVDPLAARLQLPYLLWVSFAALLNLGVLVRN